MWPGVRPFPDCAPGEPIFGLTMQQPFGSAIIDGPKRIENRPWAPPKRLHHRAFWLAMHAGATLYDGVTRESFTQPIPKVTRRPIWPECPDFAILPRRVLLGAVRVIGLVNLEEMDAYEAFGPTQAAWAFGPWCLVLDPTAIRLPTPLPYPKGALGLWRLEPSALAALRTARDDPRCWRLAP